MGAMDELMKAGFPPEQASAVVGTIRDAQRELVTKGYLRQEIGALRTDMEKAFVCLRAEVGEEIGGLRLEMREAFGGLRMEMKEDVGGLRGEMRAVFGGLRMEMKEDAGVLRGEMKEMESDFQRRFTRLYWHLWLVMGMTMTVMASLMGAMVAFFA